VTFVVVKLTGSVTIVAEKMEKAEAWVLVEGSSHLLQRREFQKKSNMISPFRSFCLS
jgi:hypothetical protein